MRSIKLRLIIVAIFVLAYVGLNLIPGKIKQQTPDENAEVSNRPCTVQNFGWPSVVYSKYGGGGYISPWEMLVTEATPIFSQWHIVGLVINIFLGGVVLVFLLWVRLPGLMGEGQENVGIIRDSDREEEEEAEDSV